MPASSPSILQSLGELPEYFQVLYNLVARDLKIKYQRSAMGFLWTLIQPAFMLGIYVVIFGVVLKMGIPNFWAYLIAGLLPFQFLIGATIEGARSVQSNGNLIRKIYFPPEVLVIATVTAKLIEFLLHLAVGIVLLILLHHGPEVRFSLYHALVVLPGAILLLYLFALGLALPLAAWSVIYRDLEHIIALAMTAWVYLTPIFWNLGSVRKHLGSAATWFVLNPAMDIIELFRGPLYYGRWPLNQAVGGGPLAAWGVAIAMGFCFFLGGYALFNRSKGILAEVV